MFDDGADFLSLLSNPLRFEILLLMADAGDAGMTVGQLVTSTGAKQPTISQQLTALFLSGFVERERKAQQVTYRLKVDAFRSIIAALSGAFKDAKFSAAA